MTTYSDLVTNIKAYTENDGSEFSAAIPTFVENTELKIKRIVGADFFRKFQTTTLTTSDPYLVVPSDMRYPRWMKLVDSNGDYIDLRQKEPGFLLTYWTDTSDEGTPRFYSKWDDTVFLLVPTPDTTYTVLLSYTYRPTILSTSNESNYISTEMGDVLLYGSLVEAYGFMKSTGADTAGDIAFWKDQFDMAMDLVKEEEERRMREEVRRYGERK